MADTRIYEYFQQHNAQIINPPESFDGIHGIQIYEKRKHNSENPDWSDIKIVVMAHEGAIDSDTWLKCQYKLSKNRKIRNAVSNKTSWLGGKIICGQCGRTMTTIKGKLSTGETRRYFSCTGKSHFRDCRGPKATIYAESLEDMVYAEIAKKLDILKSIKASDKKRATPELNEFRIKLKTIELAEQNLADTLIQSSVNSDLLEILNKKATKLKAEKSDILLRIEDLENRELDTKTVVDLSKKWKRASLEEKRGVCGILINHIVIDMDGNSEIIRNI